VVAQFIGLPRTLRGKFEFSYVAVHTPEICVRDGESRIDLHDTFV